MPLMTPDAYKASLRDGRRVFYRGEAVEDVTKHPVIGLAVDHAAIDYEMAHGSEDRALAVVEGPDGPYSRYYHIPESADDLLKRSALIERLGSGFALTPVWSLGPDGPHLPAPRNDGHLVLSAP